jgi:hypothetical protein
VGVTALAQAANQLRKREANQLAASFYRWLRCFRARQIVIAEQVEEVIALLNKAVALLSEAMTASPERQVEIRIEFDRAMRKIDEIRLNNLN